MINLTSLPRRPSAGGNPCYLRQPETEIPACAGMTPYVVNVPCVAEASA
jgi:hypothetical protein